MNLFLTLAFLFFIGAITGWVIEVLFRRFLSSANPERKWINPGFCTGTYLPVYGVGLCMLYLIASLEQYNIIKDYFWNKAILFLMMAIFMTVIEYIAGIFILKISKVRLWDYRNEPGNIQGIICPKFSIIWACLGAVYYFLIHPYILNALLWLSNNLAFSFVIGMFFGIFIIDVVNSAQLVVKLKAYAEENDVIIKYEMIKTNIRKWHDDNEMKYHFFKPFKTDTPLAKHLKNMQEIFEIRYSKHKKNK